MTPGSSGWTPGKHPASRPQAFGGGTGLQKARPEVPVCCAALEFLGCLPLLVGWRMLEAS